jgi:hypothetical protein
MLQTINGRECYVAVLTQSPQIYLPVGDDGDPQLTPYANALDTAIRTGVITEPGKYGIEVKTDGAWMAYAIIEN